MHVRTRHTRTSDLCQACGSRGVRADANQPPCSTPPPHTHAPTAHRHTRAHFSGRLPVPAHVGRRLGGQQGRSAGCSSLPGKVSTTARKSCRVGLGPNAQRRGGRGALPGTTDLMPAGLAGGAGGARGPARVCMGGPAAAGCTREAGGVYMRSFFRFVRVVGWTRGHMLLAAGLVTVRRVEQGQQSG